MIDTHCHLNFPEYEGKVADVIARATAAGVDRYVIPAVDLATTQSALALAEREPAIFAMAGVHPSEEGENEDIRWEKLLKHPKVVAVGEVGLDYYRLPEAEMARKQEVERQQVQFRWWIERAQKVSLPIVIHSRDCFADMHAILREMAPHWPVVVHCFTGTAAEAQHWLDLGYYLSFTGIVTFPKNESLREVVKMVPLDRLMVETDAPFLAPQAYRGKTNEPAYVREVSMCIATVKGRSLEEIDRQTTATAEQFFRLPKA